MKTKISPRFPPPHRRDTILAKTNLAYRILELHISLSEKNCSSKLNVE